MYIVMQLRYKRDADILIFNNIMNNIDPTGTKEAHKEDILAFFCKPGFLKISRQAVADDSDEDESLLEKERNGYYDLHRGTFFRTERPDDDNEDDVKKEDSECIKKCKKDLYSSTYTGITTALNVLSLTQLFSIQLLLANHPTIEQLNIWGGFAVAINGFFFIDLVLFLVVYGFDYIIAAKKVLILEAVLQCLAIWADVQFFSGGSERSFDAVFRAVDLYNVVALLRMLRMLYLLGEIR